MAVKPIEEVLGTYPDFKERLGWQVTQKQLSNGMEVVTGFENPRFGSVNLVVHVGDDGKPTHDQYVISEGSANAWGERATVTSAVIVPFYQNLGDGDTQADNQVYVGFVETYRPVVRDPSTGRSGWKMLELPRGFSHLAEQTESTAIRELGEETQRHTRQMWRLGNPHGGIVANSAFYATHITVWAAKVDQNISTALTPDAKEPILRSIFMPYNEVDRLVDQGKISCGLSLAALSLFDRFLRKSLA